MFRVQIYFKATAVHVECKAQLMLLDVTGLQRWIYFVFRSCQFGQYLSFKMKTIWVKASVTYGNILIHLKSHFIFQRMSSYSLKICDPEEYLMLDCFVHCILRRVAQGEVCFFFAV